MSDAEYESIKAAYPLWALTVSSEVTHNIKHENSYTHGVLEGLAAAMALTKQCGRAREFIAETEKRERKRLKEGSKH